MLYLEEKSFISLVNASTYFNLSKGGSFNQTIFNYYMLFSNNAVYVFELGIISLVLFVIINIILRRRAKRKNYYNEEKSHLNNIFAFNIFFPLLAFINHVINYAQVKMFLISRYWLSSFYVERSFFTYNARDAYVYYQNYKVYYISMIIAVNLTYLVYLYIKEYKVRDRLKRDMVEVRERFNSKFNEEQNLMK